MAAHEFKKLYETYKSFYKPVCVIKMGGEDIAAFKKLPMSIQEVTVDLTSDYKASMATFSIAGIYDHINGKFMVDKVKKLLLLGIDVIIALGYGGAATEVFRGYVARVDFHFTKSDDEDPTVQVTAMDVKGIMMANSLSKRMQANSYSDAVKEIFEQAAYQDLSNRQIITSLNVADTPDKQGGGAGGAGGGAGGAGGETPDVRIEMVAESDYDFVVKAAKRFNYEFFSLGGNVAFRKAKSDTDVLIELTPGLAFFTYDVGYDITGVSGKINVRTLDVGKGKRIAVTKKNNNKFSLGGKAKPLISAQEYSYIDPTAETQEDAEQRAQYLMEESSYRLGSLRADIIGLPEMVPGKFIKLTGFGEGVSNTFYLTDVSHVFREGSYHTIIEGKAASVGE